MNNTYEYEINVDEKHIDILGHVNNTVYLKWVQDIAVKHWDILATKEQKDTYLWVVSKHEIEYKRATYLEDEVIVKTWIGNNKRNHFERFTNFTRKSDGKLLAKCLTLWTPIDKQTKKSIQASTDIKNLFSV